MLRAHVLQVDPTAPPLPVHRRPDRTLLFSCLAMLVSYLPLSGVNGILGTLQKATAASGTDLQWLGDAFSLSLAAVVLPAGALADRFGRRRLARVGLLLTAAGAVIGSASGWQALGMSGADAVHLLWVGQAVAGTGAGLVMSSTLGLVTGHATEARARARAVSLWAVAVVVSLGAGPFLTGSISDYHPYAWALLPVAVLALGTAGLGRQVPQPHLTTGNRRGLDVPGQLTSAVAVVALVTAVITGTSHGWTSAPALTALAVAAVAALALRAVERHAREPLIPPALLRSGGFTAAGAAAAAVLFTLVGTAFVISLYTSSAGLSDVQTAVRLGLLFAGNAAGSWQAGRLLPRAGARPVLLAGLVLASAGAAALGTVGGPGTLELGWRLALLGAGSGLVMATSSSLAVQSAPPALAGLAGAANNGLRQLGAALGPAGLGAVLAGRLAATGSTTAAVHACALSTSALLLTAAVAAALLTHSRQPAA